MNFDTPNDGEKCVNAVWYTNLPHKKREESLILTERYSESAYPKYDNYDAINVNRTVDIPRDYAGVMGVPISFLEKYNPEQFEILGIANSARWIGMNALLGIQPEKEYTTVFCKPQQESRNKSGREKEHAKWM